MILNPASDRGRAARARPTIERALQGAGVRFEIAATEARGHAAELAERAARRWPVVLAAGGDGLVHEVASGLARASGDDATTPLGVVAIGSGNDFVKLLGLPSRNPTAAIAALLAGRPRQVDLGVVTDWTAASGPSAPWYFTNGIGLGFDAQVALEASRIRRLRGSAIYGLALARTLGKLSTSAIRIEVDGRVVADRALALATISNGACHGGSFWLTPDAAVDDGRLDILVAEARTPLGILALIPRVLRGKHLGARGVELLRGRSVVLSSERPLPIHADGEIIGGGVTDLRAEVLPGKLTVLA